MSTQIGILFLLTILLAVVAKGVDAYRHDGGGNGIERRHPVGAHAGWRTYMNRREGGHHYRNSHSSVRYLCPNGEFIRLGNGCYHFSTMMANWQEAHFSCNDLDPSSSLANLETAWEDKNIRTHLNRPETAALERWIGGIYDWKRGAWVWGRTGQPFSYQGFSRRSVSRPQWECTFMDPIRRYRWIHDSCLTQRHYICEAPLIRVNNGRRSDDGREPT